MATTTVTRTDEGYVRYFAERFPTPNVLRALELCESGRLDWLRVAELFDRSLLAGLEATAR